MPVHPRHLSKSAKTQTASFVQAQLAGGADRANAPFFIAPFDIRVEDIKLLPLAAKVIDADEVSTWTVVSRAEFGGPPTEVIEVEFDGVEVITAEPVGVGDGTETEFPLDHVPVSDLVVKLNGTPTTAFDMDITNPKLVIFDVAPVDEALAADTITSLNAGGTASVITIDAVTAKAFAGAAGNGIVILFDSADLGSAAGAVSYDDTAKEITITIDTNGGHGNSIITAAAIKALLEGLTVSASTGHLAVTIDTAGDGFTVAHDMGVTEATLTGGVTKHTITADYVGSDNPVPNEFPGNHEPRSIFPEGVGGDERVVPAGGYLELEIANSGTAETPATLVQIIYSNAQDL